MQKKNDKSISIQIQEEYYYKLCYVARFEYRSRNKQILYMIKEYIKNFEKQNGEIEIDEKIINNK